MSCKGTSDCSDMEGSLCRGHGPGQHRKHDAGEHNFPALRSGPTPTLRGSASYVVSHKPPKLRLVCFTRTTVSHLDTKQADTPLLCTLCGTHTWVHTHPGSCRSVVSAATSSCPPAHDPPSSVLLLEAVFFFLLWS